jgi:uncharacterized protein (TIGR04255 family)
LVRGCGDNSPVRGKQGDARHNAEIFIVRQNLRSPPHTKFRRSWILLPFCLLFPEIPPALPQGMSDFFLRFTLPVPDSPSASIVTLTFEPPMPGATVLNMVLDNEAVHVSGSLNVDTAAIWSQLAALRDLKNKVFDASLTENAKKLFR